MLDSLNVAEIIIIFIILPVFMIVASLLLFDIDKKLIDIEEESIEQNQQNTLNLAYMGDFEITFHSPKELGAKSAKQLKTATGTIPKEGRTIAVDPNIIPCGSYVYIEGLGI